MAPGSAHLGVSTPVASTNRANPSSSLTIAGEAGEAGGGDTGAAGTKSAGQGAVGVHWCLEEQLGSMDSGDT